MAASRLQTVFQDGVASVDSVRRALCIGPAGDMDFCDLNRVDLAVVQRWKPAFDMLEARGFSPRVDISDEGGAYDMALVVVPRSRRLAQIWIAQAARALGPNGVLLVDGVRTDGIDSLYKACRKLLQDFDSVTKAHGRLFVGRPIERGFEKWARSADLQSLADGFKTAPGSFSSDHVDPGSAALAAELPVDLSGEIADLGAGWGYLSAQILRQAKVTRLDLVEADHAALEAARANITDPRAAFHWADATSWAPDRPLDAIVCNPPFHGSRKADPSIGRAFMATAARSLAKSGTLWLVANRHLPYENTLGALFGDVAELSGTPAFKVLRVRRPRR